MGDHRLNNQHLGQDDNQNFQVPNLNLSLNNTPPRTSSAYSSSSNYDKQLFGCRSCTRVFFSSQALGGHMNAHRKETKAAFKKSCGTSYKHKQLQPRKTTAMYPVPGPSLHALGLVGSHALAGPEHSRDKVKLEPRCGDNEAEFRVPSLHEGVPSDRRNWPGSFRADDRHQQFPPVDESEELDLNLRL